MVILVTGLTDDPSPDGGAAPRAREMIAMKGATLDGGPVPLGPTAAHDTHRCHWGPWARRKPLRSIMMNR